MADENNTSTARDHIQTAYDRKSISTFVYQLWSFQLSRARDETVRILDSIQNETVHLPVGLDKVTDHQRNTIFLVSTELIGDARKKIVGFIVD